MSVTTQVHLLLPGSRRRVRCHNAAEARRTDRPSRVTCPDCLRLAAGAPAPLNPDQLAARAFVAGRTLVAGQWRETMPCECRALMVAGLDHTCAPDARSAGDAR